MAQATPYVRARSEPSAFEFEDSANRSNPSAYTALPTTMNDVRGLKAPNSIGISRPTSDISSEQADGSTKHHESRTYATLERGVVHEWGSTIFDVLMSLVPLFFLVIAILCLSLNQKPVSTYGQDIKAITLLSPTIFPIVYAAIFGKLLRRVALFKAERSSSVGTLEQLLGSQSFFASVERQFGMRRLNLLGIGIVVAWLLSPLGGQSSLRLLSTTVSEKVIQTPARYHAVDIFGRWNMYGEHLEDYYWSSYAPLFLSTLQTSRDNFNGSKDLFGNIRIPDITSLEHFKDTTPPSDDWYDVKDTPSVSYTSLLGSPIRDVPMTANVTFEIETGYWEILCDPFSANFSLSLINDTRTGQNETSFDMLINAPDEGKNSTTVGFEYLTRVSYREAIRSNCTAEMRAVHSEVGCIEGVCDVQRMRLSNRDMWPIFDNTSSWDTVRYITQFLPGTDLGSTSKLRVSELVEQWMTDPYLTNLITNYPGSWGGVNPAQNLTTQMFNRRLQMVINTFTDSWMGVDYRAGLDTEAPWNSTEATGVEFDTERYVCNTTFAVLTIVISSLLFATAVASVVLGIVTRAPDILGYVSTLARDNPYLQEHVPSYLDGMEASRALRDVRVIVGDVQKDADVGHVAFASMHVGPGRISRTRNYD
ncbi:hypothetical protein C7974DRAFT_200875 [Boeremia exigua]|uniref:uncharacterized protein n=1 Tax=Boeremia exigua TaxID=749465 RepID=UPI001E8DB183|nr:uncharacterized protein C7974DRAFT_200875 [Boeremia exigua]KAH6625403.1 hypothetical protein C7974DRAFT_200875 [Boeremia exigua]